MINWKFTLDAGLVYVDIEGHQTPDWGTQPPQVIVTNLKPEMWLLKKKKKTVNIV